MVTNVIVEEGLENHLRRFFQGHEIDFFNWSPGPHDVRHFEFRMARVGPGPRTSLWTYVSCGAWRANPDEGMVEFSILSVVDDPRFLELLGSTVHYHSSNRLGIGHTFPVGDPWVNGSSCDHVLVSKPYPLGPEFEICNVDGSHLHILWLLPITKAERDYKIAHDAEALESKFDAARLEYWKFDRSSVV
jgi:hypothetical protein